MAGVKLTEQKLTAMDGASLDKFGHAVAISGNYAIVGAYGDDDQGDSSGSAYIFFHNGIAWEYKQKLTVPQGQGHEKFGFAVDISGNFALVGSPGDSGQGNSSGSAYVFTFDGTSWGPGVELAAIDGSSWDSFGQSVSISGNLALVGVPGDSSQGDSSGSAYVFTFNGITSTWIQTQKLVASDASGWDRFGHAVSISGDDAIVGAPGDNDRGNKSGSAYIFSFDGTWMQVDKLTASDGAGWDKFGQSVDIAQDSIIVGAPGGNRENRSTGAAYLFYYDGNSWFEEQKITAADGVQTDYFGQSVAVSANMAAVGASGKDALGISSGAAYIFAFDGTNWREEVTFLASDGAASDYLGHSVALSEDILLLGAHGDDDKGETSGSAFACLIGNNIIPTGLIDHDHDGIDDGWEWIYVESLSILGDRTDYDKDGYTDLQEYLNWMDHGLDPAGYEFNPVIQNEPGDTGYVSPKNNFWILMMPAVLSGPGE